MMIFGVGFKVHLSSSASITNRFLEYIFLIIKITLYGRNLNSLKKVTKKIKIIYNVTQNNALNILDICLSDYF